MRAKVLTKDNANLKETWEFWGGDAEGWSNDLNIATPIIDWPDHTGVTNVVYNEDAPGGPPEGRDNLRTVYVLGEWKRGEGRREHIRQSD